MPTPVAVKLDEDVHSRVKVLAEARDRSPHWMMREAISQYVEREEKREAFRQDGIRRRPGMLFGIFLAGYGLARSIAEFFREPDAHLGFILGPVTMGQVLSVPMILLGIVGRVR